MTRIKVTIRSYNRAESVTELRNSMDIDAKENLGSEMDLSQLKYLLQNHAFRKPFELGFPTKMRDSLLRELLDYVREQNNRGLDLPFTKLSFLKASPDLLTNPLYQQLLAALSQSSLKTHELLFTQRMEENSATETLMSLATLPFTVVLNTSVETDITIAAFNRQAVLHRQAINNARRQGEVLVQSSSAFGISCPQPPEFQGKPLAIKSILLGQSAETGPLELEVQHVAMAENVEEAVAEMQQIQEVQTQHEAEDLAIYEGEVTDRDAFMALMPTQEERELTACINQEFFAKLPHGINLLTPLATQVLIENRTALAALNPENLPHNFVLKKTRSGHTILDYDPLADQRQTNAFTPPAQALTEDNFPIYAPHHGLLPDGFPRIDDASSAASFLRQNSQKLENLWYRYGDEGLHEFQNILHQFHTENSPDLSQWLYEYLLAFKHWDHFLDENHLQTSLERIKRLSPVEKAWLLAFVKDVSSSRHDLRQTLTAFDEFWSRLLTLHGKNPVRLPPNFTTPKAGHPVVFMERMITILENARNINEQMTCLDGLNLHFYHAFYASKYEGFKLVAPQWMDFQSDWSYLDEHHKVFLLQSPLYRPSLESVHSRTNNFVQTEQQGTIEQTAEEAFERALHSGSHTKQDREQTFLTSCCRYIGTQSAGISPGDFVAAVYDLKRKLMRYQSVSIPPESMLTLLLFTAHERYTPTETDCLSDFLEQTFFFLSNKEIKESFLKMLEKFIAFQHRDIKLNSQEGNAIIKNIGDSISTGKSIYRVDKVLEMMMDFLEKNKTGTFRLLRFIAEGERIKRPPRPLFAYDTAKFLSEDPLIARVYRDDLLAFSQRINHENYSDPFYNEDTLQDRATLTLPPAFESMLNAAREEMSEVRAVLHQAASEHDSNIGFACRCIMGGNSTFSRKQFLTALQAIAALPATDPHAVTTLLKAHAFDTTPSSKIITYDFDNTRLRQILIELIVFLRAEQSQAISSSSQSTDPTLQTMTVKELQTLLLPLWSSVGMIRSTLIQKVFLPALKEELVRENFANLPSHPFRDVIVEKIMQLSDYREADSFDRINELVRQSGIIARRVANILHHACCDEQLTSLLRAKDMTRLDMDRLNALLESLENMGLQNYQRILHKLLQAGDESLLANLEHLRCMQQAGLATHQIESILERLQGVADGSHFVYLAVSRLRHKPDERLLMTLMTNSALSFEHLHSLIILLQHMPEDTPDFETLLVNMEPDALNSFVSTLVTQTAGEKRAQILQIVARAFAMSPPATGLNYSRLVRRLNQLSEARLALLHAKFQQSPMGLECLDAGLAAYNPLQDFSDYLQAFEKAPFGERDFASQFDTSAVERVINTSTDMLNNGSPFAWQYRKQWMEAFLLVNRMGQNLPLYRQSAAKDLSNEDIAQLFQSIKAGNYDHLDWFNKRLFALGLVREAMYRSSKKFPNSTQMLALIDCMMHEGDVVTNIGTGEGKSLIDAMKAALLWLDCDRVDITTSSLVDARRDLQSFSPFFCMLGIPHGKRPVDALRGEEVFQRTGINYSSFAQLSLLYAKSEAEGLPLDRPSDRVALVANESDYSILEDRSIYRYARQSGARAHNWIYYAINEFVQSETFRESAVRQTTAAEDVYHLRRYLQSRAAFYNKSPQQVAAFDDEQLLAWIEAAIMVNFKLRENHDFVILPEPATVMLNGQARTTKVIKLLQEDGKISPDTRLGKGMMPMLQAKYNLADGQQSFIIDAESTTIIAANNKNLLSRYQNRGAVIWADSGTVGSSAECREQRQKYGFSFTKLASHQPQQVDFVPEQITNDESTQIERVRQILQADRPVERPKLIFCKDIDTARRFYEAFQGDMPCQLFTGVENEVQTITAAARPGMITMTTMALGRNTDINYAWSNGMSVIQTSLESERRMKQQDGRTGRQGSPGTVYRVYNQMDFNGKQKEDILAQLEEQAQQERIWNEELYDVLGYLYHKIPATRIIDVKAQWSRFSNESEKHYRALKMEGNFNRQQFIISLVQTYNQLFQPEEPVNVADVSTELSKRFALPGMTAAARRQVFISDCIAPEIIALEFVASGETVIDAEVIKGQIRAVLEAENTKTALDGYVRWLQLQEAPLQAVRQAHQSALTEWVATHSAHRSWMARWFGGESPFASKLNDRNYIVLFYSLQKVAEAPGEAADSLACMKLAATRLLEEYISASWFVSFSRRNQARTLIRQIDSAESMTAMVDILASKKLQAIRSDIRESGLFFRKNRSGHSRFQHTVDTALQLAASLGEESETLINELCQELTETGAAPISETEYLHDLPEQPETQRSGQRGNAKVLASSLMKALDRKTMRSKRNMPQANIEQDAPDAGSHI